MKQFSKNKIFLILRYVFGYIFIFLFIYFCPGIGFTDSVYLNDLLISLDASLEWEPVMDIGRISKGYKWVSFRLGSPFILFGEEEILNTDNIIRQHTGGILLPETAALKIINYFTITREPESITSEKEPSVVIENNNHSQLLPKVAVVLIDPGHGGRDPGAIGSHWTENGRITINEKDIVLNVAKKLQLLLSQKYPSKKIELTRTNDSYLTLEQRTEKANNVSVSEEEAVIFISLHANASFSGTANGFEVWYLPPEYKRELINEQNIENGNEDIAHILNEMLDAEYTTESVILANNILDELDIKIGDVSENRGLKEELWFVVRKSKMPSVLVELGFVTNKEEGLRLRDNEYLQRLALGLYNGIISFITKFEDSKGFTE